MSQASEAELSYSVMRVLQHDDPNFLEFTFVLRNVTDAVTPLQVFLSADLRTNEIAIRGGMQELNDSMQEKVMKEVQRRLALRQEWIDRMQILVNLTNVIGTANGWQTKELSKTLNDREFGRHDVAALVMQKDLCQLMLEPHGRTAPGVEGGFAGIYLMPAYDDAASLHFYDGRWNIHVRAKRSSIVARVAIGEAMPFTEKSLLSVLGRLHSNASYRFVGQCDS